MEQKKEKMPLRAKIVIIGILIAATAAFSMILWRFFYAAEGSFALVYQEGRLIQRISLTDVGEPYEIRIEGKDGAYNILEVQEGKIGVTEASCPDKLCKNQGFISNSLMPVTCLPNHLVVKVAGEEAAQQELDGISY